MRKLGTALVLTLMTVGLALPAAATHTHVRMTGNGECVILAKKGGEKYVELPNTDQPNPARRHPLHVNVHLGEPGLHGQIGVLGVSDGFCGGNYLND